MSTDFHFGNPDSAYEAFWLLSGQIKNLTGPESKEIGKLSQHQWVDAIRRIRLLVDSPTQKTVATSVDCDNQAKPGNLT